MDDLDRLIEVLCAESRVPVSERIRKAGFEDEALEAVLSRPDALQRVFAAGVKRYLIPLIPGLLKGLAGRCEGGDKAAQGVVLNLLGDKSPVREAAAMDVSSSSDQALLSRAMQLSEQLAKMVSELGSKKSKDVQ